MLISLVEIDRHVEVLGPCYHRCVIVRMRNRDGLQSAEALNGCNGLIVKQRDAVPEEVPLLCLHQQGALADGKLRLCADPYQARFVLLEDVMEALFPHRGKRCPLLPLMADILTLVQADRAAFGRRLTLGKLCPTSNANPMFHLTPSNLFYRMPANSLLTGHVKPGSNGDCRVSVS